MKRFTNFYQSVQRIFKDFSNRRDRDEFHRETNFEFHKESEWRGIFKLVPQKNPSRLEETLSEYEISANDSFSFQHSTLVYQFKTCTKQFFFFFRTWKKSHLRASSCCWTPPTTKRTSRLRVWLVGSVDLAFIASRLPCEETTDRKSVV